jgi:O-antigen/teichoic acid export membrane protein
MIFGYGAVALAVARNIFLVPVYLHHISLGEYGAWLATGGALTQILVTDFGLSGVITQRVARRFGAGDAAGLGPLIAAGLANGAALGVLLTGISLVLAYFLPATQGLSAAAAHRVLQCFLIAVCANGIGVLANTASGIIRSLQRAVAVGTVTLFADVASIFVTISGLFLGAGLYAIAIGLLVRSACTAICSLGLIAMYRSRHGASRLRFDWAESRALWRDSAHFFLTSIAMKLQTNANTLFVGALLGPQTAAVYGLTVRAHETVLMLIGQINVALGPSLAHLVGEERLARFQLLLIRLLPATAAIAAVGMTVTVTLNASFVQLWVGAGAFGGQTVSIVMGSALFVAALAYVAYDALLARGEFHFISRTFMVSSVLHVTVLLVLVPHGLWGAPVAVLVATCCWGIPMWLRIASTSQISRLELGRMFRDPILTGLIGCATGILFALYYPKVGSWSGLFGEGVACSAVLATLLLLLRPSLRTLLREELSLTARAL